MTGTLESKPMPALPPPTEHTVTLTMNDRELALFKAFTGYGALNTPEALKRINNSNAVRDIPPFAEKEVQHFNLGLWGAVSK